MGGDVLIEPAVQEHVADGGGHGDQVKAEERQTVKPGAIQNMYKIASDIRNNFYFICGIF